jgi:hypothetical protein
MVIKLRRIICVGDTASTGEIRTAYKILIGILERLGILRAVTLKFTAFGNLMLCSAVDKC